ncbi:30S ribosomal protein S16 [Candidatus Poribacteria bacterium]|nr:MAG: 30S ribosomal protein S16 [Candidatus Poribacteria bacterium]
MPVRIRLQRAGRRNRPFYRVVVADSRSPRDGKYIEKIGYYDPIPDPAVIVIDEEKALKWLLIGAEPTDTVRSLLRKVGVWAKFAAIRDAREAERKRRKRQKKLAKAQAQQGGTVEAEQTAQPASDQTVQNTVQENQ